MSLIARMESKLGRFAIPNLTTILIAGQVFLYMADSLLPARGDGGFLERVQLLPAEVLSGEVWRLVTFLFNPPADNFVFALIFWSLFYLMGTTLEINWGTFRYNIFLFVGYIACLLSAFIAYFVTGLNLPAGNGFLYGTVFLAFARLYPEFVLHIMFVLPVKIKWLAMLQWIIYGLGFVSGDAMVKGMIVASVANYFLFFGRDIWESLRHGRRRMHFQTRVMKGAARIVHKCAICGLTSETSPQTQFRYCSKCDGELCYCPEHLQNHEHKSQGAAEVTAR